jgi:hypothetical protein
MRLVVASLVLTLCAAARADDHHAPPTVKPIKKDGKVIGARISTVMIKELSFGSDHSYLHLGSMALPGPSLPKGSRIDQIRVRRLAAGQAPGYARWSSGPIVARFRQPTEVSFDFIYGQGNDLKPGQRVDVYSTWNQSGGDDATALQHVWGMHDGPMNQDDKAYVVTLPGD